MRLIINSGNRGFCAANNQGFAASRSEFVALLNNDAEAEPGWLEALEAVIRQSDDIGMAASKILVWEDPRRIDKCGHLIYPDGQNRGRGAGQFDDGQFDRVEEVLWPDGCAAMYRRAMLEDVGGFDEDFFAYADDAELGLRGRIAGWRCLYAPGAVVRHHRGATLGLGSARRLTLIERNRVLLVVKLFPWNLLWANGAYHLARIAAGLWAAARNRGEIRHYPGIRGKLRAATALVQGMLSALPMIPTMLRKRRAFRSHHRLTPSQIRGCCSSTGFRSRNSPNTRIEPAAALNGMAHAVAPAAEVCPACEGTEARVLFSATDRLYHTTTKVFQIVECRNCRLIRLSPQPTPLELREYYPPDYWFVPETTAADRLEQWYRRFVLRDHLRFVERALRESEEDGVVLDVGCGGGLFLQMLSERGVKRVAGLDFSLDAASVAWRRSGVPAVCATLIARAFCSVAAAPSITMFHVLEHLYDPGALSRRRASAAAAQWPPDRAGSQCRLLAVPAVRRALERHRCAAAFDRFPPVRSRRAARSLRL